MRYNAGKYWSYSGRRRNEWECRKARRIKGFHGEGVYMATTPQREDDKLHDINQQLKCHLCMENFHRSANRTIRDSICDSGGLGLADDDLIGRVLRDEICI